jgi:hypothetical protein
MWKRERQIIAAVAGIIDDVLAARPDLHQSPALLDYVRSEILDLPGSPRFQRRLIIEARKQVGEIIAPAKRRS